ncbi:hypothetical protein HPB50_013206 [Hyalomma asiaticum]|uniref:Uncharacterized protein n=1 Tax=Hyalomma asiaticum TaxID=266040 RepID=A0ACB7TFT0_HYAAI|nr:hypothetical protein HPB50_013206 [Hyalomma asiaticum]
MITRLFSKESGGSMLKHMWITNGYDRGFDRPQFSSTIVSHKITSTLTSKTAKYLSKRDGTKAIASPPLPRTMRRHVLAPTAP